MFNDLISAGGPGLLIPVVLFALLLYAIRGLFGLHGRRSQHRREFLEHWDPKRIDDDLWLEVTIRHLYGTHLPAHVIRTAFAHPHTSQALLDLSNLWDFFNYDPDDRAVAWKYQRHRNAQTSISLAHAPILPICRTWRNRCFCSHTCRRFQPMGVLDLVCDHDCRRVFELMAWRSFEGGGYGGRSLDQAHQCRLRISLSYRWLDK